MPAFDLDPSDLDEVRRRVVDPLLAALFGPGEVQSVDLVVRADEDYGWTRSTTTWPGPRWLYLKLTAGGEEFDRRLDSISFGRTDGLWLCADLASNLGDWICESAFGWGQARWCTVRPLPRVWAAEHVLEIYVDEHPSPLFDRGRNVDPSALGVSAELTEALLAWRTLTDDLLRSLPTEDSWDEIPPALPVSPTGADSSSGAVRRKSSAHGSEWPARARSTPRGGRSST